MKKKRASIKKVNRELAYVFGKSPSANSRRSKFRTEEQRFVIENHYGTLECRYDARAAERQIDSILFAQFLERHEREFDAISRRHKGRDSYLQDEETKALLKLSKEEREKYVPLALKLLAEQLQPSLERALKNAVNSAAVKAIKQLEELTGIHNAASAEELTDLLMLKDADEMKAQLPGRAPNRPPKWNRAMLERVVAEVTNETKTKRRRLPTLRDVAKRLNALSNSKPPLNADKAGKLLRRHGIDFVKERNKK